MTEKRNSMRITHQQAIEAVQIIIQLADGAEEGGLAAELRIGRDGINTIVDLAKRVRENE